MIKTLDGSNEIYTIDRNSKVFDSITIEKNNIHTVGFDFPSFKGYKSGILATIDTGASNTAITIAALFDNITDVQYNVLMDGIKRANSYVYSFSSVAGEKDVNAALCILPEIAIGGFRIKDFPFYLIDDLNKQQALLGNDFLTSCDVIQVKEECLSAYNFDKTQMMTKMMSTHAFHLLTLSSL